VLWQLNLKTVDKRISCYSWSVACSEILNMSVIMMRCLCATNI